MISERESIILFVRSFARSPSLLASDVRGKVDTNGVYFLSRLFELRNRETKNRETAAVPSLCQTINRDTETHIDVLVLSI